MCKPRYHQKNGFKRQHTSAYYKEHRPKKSKFSYTANYTTSAELEAFLFSIRKTNSFVSSVSRSFNPFSDEYQIVLLYSAIKDKICNVDILQLLKIKPSIAEATVALIPIDGETYAKYITRISRIPKAENVYKYIVKTNRKVFYEKVNDNAGSSTNNDSVQQPQTNRM